MLCTICGSIMGDAEAKKHICETSDIPKPNEEIKRDGTKKSLS